MIELPQIYGITHSRDSLNRDNITVVKEMIRGGIKFIQYREKDLTLKQMLTECLEIREITRNAGVTFIINDHIDIALLVDADGVHVGQDDLPALMVRKLIGFNKILGVSTHEESQALQAIADGADYIGVGPIFKTQTKDNVCDPVGYTYLEWVTKHIKIPFVAIGGIKASNIREILNRDAKCISLVSEITSSSNIKEKIDQLNTLIEEYKHDI